jgi:CelD/BcsL family acetyltransferase involved in cellulose biosynthesis
MRYFFKKIVRRFSKNEWIELLLLFQHERMMAGLLAFDYKNIIYLFNTAYSSDYAWYSPGTYLFYKMIISAIKDNKEKVDFLRGRENYKYFFQAKESKIKNLIIVPGE